MTIPTRSSISIYTDGSCNPVQKIGGWAAIVLLADQKIILQGKEADTTHQRMELTAALRALEYLQQNQLIDDPFIIYTDSQYLVDLKTRYPGFIENNFLTKKGNGIRNADLVTKLGCYFDQREIHIEKVRAHQKATATLNYNREVDKIVRQIVRDHFR